MADVENNNNGHQHGDRSVEVRVSAQLENLAVVRTVVAAIGTFEDLDFDAVSDLRLAVDEACTRLIRSAVPNSTLGGCGQPTRDRGGGRGVDHMQDPGHPDSRQLQLARAEFAHR